MKRFLYLIVIALISGYCYSQTICSTPSETTKLATESMKKAMTRSGGDTLRHYLKVYFHVIRQSNGTGGQSYSNVTTAYNTLQNDFNPHRIVFLWDGIVDYINDSSLYTNASSSVFNYNDNQDGIDIYLFPDNNSRNEGHSNGVGSSPELYVSGKYWKTPYPPLVTSHVISHEMGHVLNLWHTHHGTFTEYLSDLITPYPNQCKELVNGSNSSTCGDFISDTPADPCLDYKVDPVTFIWNDSGIDANGDAYNPDVRLIMSYTDIRCMQYFSTMQGMVMRSAIEDLPLLRNIETATLNISLNGNTVMCDTATYTLAGLHPSLSVSWSINNSNFTLIPSGNHCVVEYTGFPQYDVANLTATISWQGHTIKTLTKHIIMQGTDIYVIGWQNSLASPNGTYPEIEFTIPNNDRALPSGTKPEKPNMEDFIDKESLPIDFIDDIIPIEPDTLVDLCGYGVTDIYGGNMVYLSSNCFDGMDISFSGNISPTYFHRSNSSGSVIFNMPYQVGPYYTTLHAQSEGHCHDFCLTFKVIPLPGYASGDDEIEVNYTGSMLYITFLVAGEPCGNGQFYFPSYSVTITRIPAGTQVYSGVFPGEQGLVAVNTSTWLPGIYSIRIVCNGHTYTKTIYL